MDTLTASRWDDEYRNQRYANEPPLPFVDRILETLRADDSAGHGTGLYVGCGNGRNYLPLVDAGLELFGLDVSPEAIKQLLQRRPTLPALRLLCDDFREFKSPLPRFDYLIAIQVFQHGADADVAAYCERAAALLRPGGLLFLRVNSVSTQIYHAHTVVDRNAWGGLTVRYDDGPKSGLLVRRVARPGQGAGGAGSRRAQARHRQPARAVRGRRRSVARSGRRQHRHARGRHAGRDHRDHGGEAAAVRRRRRRLRRRGGRGRSLARLVASRAHGLLRPGAGTTRPPAGRHLYRRVRALPAALEVISKPPLLSLISGRWDRRVGGLARGVVASSPVWRPTSGVVIRWNLTVRLVMSKPYPHLAILLVVPTLLVGANGTAARADWQTRVPYAEGVLLLHWRHIYEGKDTVDRLEIKPTQASSTVFIVSGQPVFDAKKRMVAFPYCADDGCESKIDLIDLIERKRLPAITLNYNGQFYLECRWVDNVLRVAVE